MKEAPARYRWSALAAGRADPLLREGTVNRFAKLVAGAAAGVGLLALVFAGRGDSDDAADPDDARAPSVSEDQVASVRAAPGPEGSGVLSEDLEGTDLFVG